MSAIDRLRELVYVAPSGREHRPLWDDVSRESSKKAAVHEIPQSDLADVQDLGHNAERWTMSLYFVGADHDQPADAFYDALRERGRAVLRHPRFGDLDVLALTFSQTEDWVEGLRASRFQVEFVHAPDLSLISATNTAAAIQSAADDAASEATLVGAQVDPPNETEKAKFKDRVIKRVRDTAKKLKAIAAQVDDTRQAIEAQARAIERNIDALVALPLDLAADVVALARLPARLVVSVKDKTTTYSDLITDAVTNVLGLTVTPALAVVIDLLALVIAMCESVTEGDLLTRDQAITAHDTLVASIAQVETAIDSLRASGYVPDPSLLALIADLKARAAAYLLSAAYDLPAERTVTLEAASTPLEQAHLLLGSADLADSLITLNGWGGDMILVLPRGTEVRYYA